jgi:hypothetical protein
MANVFKFPPRRFPRGVGPCLAKLAEHAEQGRITGAAFVCLIGDDSYIADTCGDASNDHDKVRKLLRALDAKVAKRQLRDR